MAIWITRLIGPDSRVRLRVEGQLVRQWCFVLEAECRRFMRHRASVVLDLTGVTFIDSLGLETLKGLEAEGVEMLDLPLILEEQLRGE